MEILDQWKGKRNSVMCSIDTNLHGVYFLLNYVLLAKIYRKCDDQKGINSFIQVAQSLNS